MKLSKSTLIATLALTATSTNALVVQNPFSNIQQALKLDLSYDKLTSKLTDTFEQGKANIISTIAKVMNEPLDGLTPEIKNIWLEMLMKFPNSITELNFKAPPKKGKITTQQFDFHVTDAQVPNHKLRIKSTPKDLGIDTVKQYSGYLDVVDEDKHFFYYFFESRNDPKNDPVILWLNGGPGCSSLTGLFFELGPSSIDKNLKPVYNPHSWNANASVIFLDQPINVGYSYSSQSVSNTIAAGKDVYAFLQLFFKNFPEYANLDFHIAGESYAGHYIPAFASEILTHPERNFNLTSVLIGNGLTDPLVQYEYYEPMACGEGGEPSVLEPEECDGMLNLLPRCLSLIESCYESGSVWSCVPATIYCNNGQMGPYQKPVEMCMTLELCVKVPVCVTVNWNTLINI